MYEFLYGECWWSATEFDIDIINNNKLEMFIMLLPKMDDMGDIFKYRKTSTIL